MRSNYNRGDLIFELRHNYLAPLMGLLLFISIHLVVVGFNPSPESMLAYVIALVVMSVYFAYYASIGTLKLYSNAIDFPIRLKSKIRSLPINRINMVTLIKGYTNILNLRVETYDGNKLEYNFPAQGELFTLPVVQAFLSHPGFKILEENDNGLMLGNKKPPREEHY